MYLLNKYLPKTFDDIIGNNTIITKLLKDLKKSKYRGKYLLTGRSGTGRTTLINLISNQQKLKIQEVSLNEISTRGDISNNKELKLIFKKSIIPKIILIDDVDLSTSNTSLRNNIESKLKALKTLINKDKTNLIFIISTENKKSIFKEYNGLKTFTFQKVRDDTIIRYIEKIIKSENIKVSEKTGSKVIGKIIQSANGNIRKIITNLEILMTGKKKIAYTEDSKEVLQKTNNDVTFKDIYEFMGEALKPCNMNNIKEYEAHEKLFFSDSFMIQASTYEYYLKGENIKNTQDVELSNGTIESIADGDVINNSRRDCDFGLMPYIANLSFVKPIQLVGKPKTQLFFPSNVSKQNKVLNNHKKIRGLKLEAPETMNYNFEEYNAIQVLQKNYKKKDHKINQTILKNIFTIIE
jgi:DNA polymerase III delta prime subunit